MTPNKDTPAFPTITWDQMADGQFVQITEHAGLTKREEVAARAMAALIGNWEASCKICDSDPRYDGTNFKEVVAMNSAEFADALIDQLSKP